MIFFYSKKNAPISPSSFDADLSQKLGNPKFASAYIMSAIVDNDLNFLPIALGDVAKAHGVSKLAEQTGINRRTLYKVFDKKVHPISVLHGWINGVLPSAKNLHHIHSLSEHLKIPISVLHFN